MIKSIATVASVLALALGGGAALAQTTTTDKKAAAKKADRQEWEKQFKAHDKNKDGGLSKDELGSDSKVFPLIRQNFDAMDVSPKDGKVTIAEHDAWEKKMRADKKATTTK